MHAYIRISARAERGGGRERERETDRERGLHTNRRGACLIVFLLFPTLTAMSRVSASRARSKESAEIVWA
jgi:hypothetical protein